MKTSRKTNVDSKKALTVPRKFSLKVISRRSSTWGRSEAAKIPIRH